MLKALVPHFPFSRASCREEGRAAGRGCEKRKDRALHCWNKGNKEGTEPRDKGVKKRVRHNGEKGELFFFFLFYSHSQSLWRRRLPSAFRSFVQEQQTSFKDGPKRGSIITFSGRFMIHYDVFNARYLLSFPVCISFFLLKIISNPSGPILPSSLSLRHYHSAKSVGEARTAIISTTRPNEKESESILQHAPTPGRTEPVATCKMGAQRPSSPTVPLGLGLGRYGPSSPFGIVKIMGQGLWADISLPSRWNRLITEKENWGAALPGKESKVWQSCFMSPNDLFIAYPRASHSRPSISLFPHHSLYLRLD